MKQIKLEARERTAQILKAALQVAARVGYTNLKRDDVAKAAGISASLVPYHMGTMTEFRRSVMREAVRTGHLPVIAQGIANRDRQALKAPEEVRQRAIQSLK